jgi:hypothetical protein
VHVGPVRLIPDELTTHGSSFAKPGFGGAQQGMANRTELGPGGRVWEPRTWGAATQTDRSVADMKAI